MPSRRLFESDASWLRRCEEEQREINQRLHESARRDSLARGDAELRTRWIQDGMNPQAADEWFRSNPR